MDVIGIDRRCALPTLHGIDSRLGRRYTDLFLTHLSDAQKLAAGFHANPAVSAPFAATQAAWRFFNNDAVTLAVLAGPLLECACREIPLACDNWLLVAMDWSNLRFNSHHSKAHPQGKTPVFIIDREGDSVGHFRDWDMQDHRFVVRADDEPHVLYNKQNMVLLAMANRDLS